MRVNDIELENIIRLLSMLPWPTIVVDESLKVVSTTTSVDTAISDKIIAVQIGKPFRLPDKRDHDRFLALIAASANVPGGRSTQRMLLRFALPDFTGPNVVEVWPLKLKVTPAGAEALDGASGDAASAPNEATLFAISFKLRKDLTLPTAKEVQQALSVSPMEADAVVGLLQGLTAEEQAQNRGVAADTVRWHVKNAFLRTHCEGRAELIQLVMGLVGATFSQGAGKG